MAMLNNQRVVENHHFWRIWLEQNVPTPFSPVVRTFSCSGQCLLDSHPEKRLPRQLVSLVCALFGVLVLLNLQYIIIGVNLPVEGNHILTSESQFFSALQPQFLNKQPIDQ